MKKKLIDATDIKTVDDLAQAIADGRELIGERIFYDEYSGEEVTTECPLGAKLTRGVLSEVLDEYTIKEWVVDVPWYEQLEETGPVWCYTVDDDNDMWITLLIDVDSKGIVYALSGQSYGMAEKYKPLTKEQLEAFGLKNGY